MMLKDINVYKCFNILYMKLFEKFNERIYTLYVRNIVNLNK